MSALNSSNLTDHALSFSLRGVAPASAFGARSVMTVFTVLTSFTTLLAAGISYSSRNDSMLLVDSELGSFSFISILIPSDLMNPFSLAFSSSTALYSGKPRSTSVIFRSRNAASLTNATKGSTTSATLLSIVWLSLWIISPVAKSLMVWFVGDNID